MMASLADLLDYDQRKRQALQALTDYASSQYKLGSAFGEGLSDQAKGLAQMAMHPIDTATQMYQAGKAVVQNPRAAVQAAKEGLTEAVSSPQNIARFAGQNFNPLELANALNKVGTMRQIFVGKGSKTWDKAAHEAALKLEKEGATPEQIWEQTGNWKNPDGEWRQEISDVNAKFRLPHEIHEMAHNERAKIDAMRQQSKDIAKGLKTQPDLFEKELKKWNAENRAAAKAAEQKLNENYGLTHNPQYFGNYAPIAYQHPGLYEAYPQLAKVVIRQGNPNETFLGSYTPGLREQTVGSLDVNKGAFGSGRSPESTTAHEMQHAIQGLEGFNTGGSSETMANVLYYKRGDAAALARTDKFKEGMAKQEELNRKIMETPSDPNDPYGIPQNLLDEQAKIDKEYPVLDQWRKLSRQVSEWEQLGPDELYRRLGGEAEARATQNRLKLTPEQRRKTFPEASYDVPIKDLIISKTGYF